MGLLKDTKPKTIEEDKTRPNLTVADGFNLGIGLGIAWLFILPFLLIVGACSLWMILAFMGIPL